MHALIFQTDIPVITKGLNEDTGEEVAIKLEHHFMESHLLQGEVEIYKALADRAGVPRVYWYGAEYEYRAIVFDLLGPTLYDLLYFCGDRFSLKTVLMLADQLLCRLKNFHSKGFIHRDIKPNNIMMGVGRRRYRYGRCHPIQLRRQKFHFPNASYDGNTTFRLY